MATIFILANTVRPSLYRRSDDNILKTSPSTFLEIGQGEVMTAEKIFIHTKEACPHHIIVILAPLLPFGVRHNTN